MSELDCRSSALLMCNKKCAGIASRIEQRWHRKLSSIRIGRPLGARGAARSIFPSGGELWRGLACWIDSIPEADLSAPHKQWNTAKRVYDRAVGEMGHGGSQSSIRRCVAAWRGERGAEGRIPRARVGTRARCPPRRPLAAGGRAAGSGIHSCGRGRRRRIRTFCPIGKNFTIASETLRIFF